MLTRKQLDSVIINAIAVKMLITFPHNIIEICKNAAWISAIYCTVIALLLSGAVYFLYSSDKNIIELSEKYGKKTLRVITGLAVFVVLFANFFTLIRIFPEAIRLVLLQSTYVELIGLLFAVGLVLGAYCGIESIARVSEMFLPVAGIVFVTFIILLVPTLNPENIFPVLGSGMYDLFAKNIPFLSVFSDLLMLNLLIPYMEDASDYRKAGIRSTVIGGLYAITVIAAYCLSYAYPVTEKYLMPVYQLERLIRLSSFFSRLEAAFQFIWSISILLYGSLCLALMAEAWRTGFGLKDSKPLLPSIMAVMVGASLLPDNLLSVVKVEAFINRWIYIPSFALPIIFGIIERASKHKNVSRET